MPSPTRHLHSPHSEQVFCSATNSTPVAAPQMSGYSVDTETETLFKSLNPPNVSVLLMLGRCFLFVNRPLLLVAGLLLSFRAGLAALACVLPQFNGVSSNSYFFTPSPPKITNNSPFFFVFPDFRSERYVSFWWVTVLQSVLFNSCPAAAGDPVSQ